MKKKIVFAIASLLLAVSSFAQTVPVFSEDFEGSTTGWTFVNGSGTNANQWHVGSATNAVKSGSKAAYISYDGGTTYSYDVNSASRTHLYRDITFPTASPVTRPFMLTFDWKCMGETNAGGTTYYDYLSMFLSPTSSTPTAGGIFTGSSELNRWAKSSAWQQETVTLPGMDYTGVTKRLVLSWVNDGSGGANPPIAIDNIVIAPAVGVTFNSQGGSAVALRYVASGAKVTAPSAPTRTGYIFDAWYIDAGYTTAWNFSTSLVTSDTTLYAKWDVRVDAEKPAIGTQPTGGAVTQGATNTTLTVGASVSDGGTLTYQWYKPTTAVKTGGSTLSSATNAAYTTPANLALGSHYYYVVITNTNNGVNGTRTAKDTSDVVTVTVVQPIDAEKPNITTQPQNTATYDEGDVATALTVSVAPLADGGTLSYQWYQPATAVKTGGTVLNGSTAASYTPSTATVGTAYYYVVVTNTNTGATGAQTTKDTSNVTVVIVNALVDAEKPNITAQPQNTTTYNEGDAAAALTVSAAPLADGGTLSYQWYSNGTNSTTGGTALTDSTAASYTPSTATVGTAYYYVVVTNTNTGATGAQTTKDTSNVAVVIVNALVDAEKPTITTQPQNTTTYNEGDAATALTVSVAPLADGGTLSYQWYQPATAVKTGGTVLIGSTAASYTPSTATVGTAYYYVVVTNTNTGATGAQTAKDTSDVAVVIVNALVDAEKPTITTQPQNTTTYNEGDAATALTVSVAPLADGGTLTYQWYQPATAVKTGGTALTGSTAASYTPSTATVGTAYYYVVVTNTNTGATGAQTAKDTSDVAVVIVNALVDAEKPTITTQPQNTTTYDEGDAAAALTVSVAPLADGGTLTYQWYQPATAVKTGGTALTGSTAASYTPSTTTVGTAYYYVVVTNTNTGATGAQTAKDTSNVAVVTVTAAPPTGTAPTITTTSLPAGTVGTAYSQTLTATGSTPITWSVTVGTLPAGLSLNSSTGEISGTPTTAEAAVTFTVQAANGTSPDDTKALSITINAAAPTGTAPTITTTSLPAGTVGAAYSQTLAATGSTPITWSVTVGTLPAGLSLNSSTGEISGTPTTAEAAVTFTVQAANGTSPDDTQVLSITINAAAPTGTAPTITTTSLPAGTVGTAYSQTLTATGSTPITWSVTVGTLPAGLSLNASTGEISGTPTTAEAAVTFTVQAANGTSPDDTQVLSITINAAAPTGTAPTIAEKQALVLSAYPNPTTNILYVENADNKQVNVYSPNGNLLLRTTGSAVNLSGYPTGIYIIKVGNKVAKVEKQ
ncbi:hypothetical protein FACS1894201_08440 [Bacteroidia bacterium]|nr:hypothetical protein FACS1894201_08440 [Bacteroidia bacterium]